jgi:AcrR family transcriptional regulator
VATAARAPVPRGPRARERVLRAALEVLADRGMPGFTMEAIAHRAGASKATLYRHWPSPAALLVDAMDMSFQPFPLPATGELRTDLIELLTRSEALLGDRHFPGLMAAVVDAAEREPAISQLHVQLTERRREPGRRVLAQAQQRGELPASADLELAVDLLTAPFFYRRFIAHRAFPPGYAAAIVDHVLAALRGDASRDAVPCP